MRQDGIYCASVLVPNALLKLWIQEYNPYETLHPMVRTPMVRGSDGPA